MQHTNPTCGDELTLRIPLTGSGAEAVVATKTVFDPWLAT
jgi:NifU-like protein involved in Fe-S cluster formation